MPLRIRTGKNKGLPPNLYHHNNWYKYRNPKTGKVSGMGSSRQKAVEATQQLNALLMEGRDLVARVVGTDAPFSTFLDKFTNEILAGRKLAQKTRDLYRQKMVHIRKQFGNKITDEITIKDVADFLSKFPARSSNQYRSRLADIFKYAIANGLCVTNPAIATIPKEEEKLRGRLSLDGYYAIYEKAEQWLKNAMDISLQTLQRREDVAKMQKTDIKEGNLYVIQTKTEKHGEAAYLKIKIDNPLQEVINRCLDDIVSPYLIHRLPERIPAWKDKAKTRDHLTQVLPEIITRRFKRARDESKFYDHLPVNERPTFHEIRSLGADLYDKAGIDPQTLLGHTDREMTEHYLEGHGIQWTETSAGLNISRKNKIFPQTQ